MRPSIVRAGEQLHQQCSMQTYHSPNQPHTRPSPTTYCVPTQEGMTTLSLPGLLFTYNDGLAAHRHAHTG